MFSLLNIAHLSYWTSTFAGNAAGACVSYLLNRSYTFNSKVSYQRGLPRFVLIILFCYFSAYFCSERLVEWISPSLPLSASLTENASILLGSALYTISNYFGQKYLVFKKLKEFSY
jgi:putative flippase GtrA